MAWKMGHSTLWSLLEFFAVFSKLFSLIAENLIKYLWNQSQGAQAPVIYKAGGVISETHGQTFLIRRIGTCMSCIPVDYKQVTARLWGILLEMTLFYKGNHHDKNTYCK
jgi:hypothetical protein